MMTQHFAFRLASVIVPMVLIGLFVTLALTGSEAEAVATDPATQTAAVRSVEPTTQPSDDGYPIDVCPVSGGKLGSMGVPPSKVIDDREVKVCCDGCFATFEGDAETYHRKMDDLILDATAADYPLETCIVSDEPMELTEVVTVYRPQNRVVKFCCGSCEVLFDKEPEKYLAKLDE